MRPWSRALLVAVALAVAVGAEFVAPYGATQQHRSHSLAAPSSAERLASAVRFFSHGDRYRWLGLVESDRHLFGFEGDAVFPLGTDALGRDLFSRLLLGGRLSLGIGLAAALLAVILATGLGGLAGFVGGRADALFLRVAELFLALPWLLVVLALRALLPIDLGATASVVATVVLLGALSWVRTAVVIRSEARAVASAPFLTAARGFGASRWQAFGRHVWPAIRHSAGLQLLLLWPRLVVAEVTLSFLGLGVSPPSPSWGQMLADLRLESAVSYPWLYAPAAALVLVTTVAHSLWSGASGFLSDRESPPQAL